MIRVVEELFVELFSGADACEFYLYILVWFVAVEPYEGLGHLRYVYGLSHVKDKELSAFSHRPCPEDKADSFRDEHEVALHVLVCYCHRASALYLLFELGDDAAAASQDVSEAHSHIGCIRVSLLNIE
ncbi:hypothetical protein SDC9_174373 [bioreactor metagenome]|uniref:Uncharacterized protein n=1 Tax=bioreactor metagenome TaxID=1076179 RepID=A0A645GJ66_9ZZZZ